MVSLPVSFPSVRHTGQGGHVYRPDIDGLRAVAIMAVVAFHARLAWFGGGFVGVDVFLVMSGYLIGSLVYRDVLDSRFAFLRFYERRAKRILPALLMVLLVCNIVAFVLLSPLELRDYCAQSFSAAASGSNIYYWLKSNYFNPASAFKPLLMTWSLGIEEQFYLLFPLCIFLVNRFARRRVLLIASVACAVSFVACVLCSNVYPSAAFYLLPTRAWELGLGVLIAMHEVERGAPRLNSISANLLGWFGLAMIVVSVRVFSDGTRFPGIAALLPTVGTACLITARESFVNRRFLASRPMVFIGLVSYSWYLWHWPMMSFARIVSGGLLSVPRAVLIGALTFALGVFSYRFVEQPFRRARIPTYPLFAGCATALAVCATVPMIGYLQSGWPGRIPELRTLEVTIRSVERNPCLADFEESKPLLRAPCVEGGAGSKLALLGDSHAAALGAALHKLAQQHGYGFEMFAKASCPPLADVSLQWPLHPTFEQTCVDFNRAVLRQVVSDPSIHVVVLAGFWSAPLLQGSRQCYSDVSRSGMERCGSYTNFHAGLLNAILRLRSSGKQVFVATDVPRFETDPMSIMRNSVIRLRGGLATLLSPHTFSLAAVPEGNLTKPADAIADREVRHAALEGGAQLLDLHRNLCAFGQCRFWQGGVMYYSDNSHLTPAGAEYALRGQDPILAAN